MVKKDLRKMPTLAATPAMRTHAGETVDVRLEDRYWENGAYVEKQETAAKPLYDLFVRGRTENGIGKLAVFLTGWLLRGVKTPRYEIYINPEGQEWITRELDENGVEKRWLTARADNLDGIAYWSRKQTKNDYRICMKDRNICGKEKLTADVTRFIDRLPFPEGTEPVAPVKGLERLKRWQEAILQDRIKEREKREQKPWDDDMALITDIPEKFRQWMEQDVVKEDYIFYSYRRGGARTGWCRCCAKEVALTAVPHHRDKTVCPECGRECVLICASRVKTTLKPGRIYRGWMLQDIPGGFAARRFTAACRIRMKDYRHPEYSIMETERDLVLPDGIRYYTYSMYKNKYVRWCRVNYRETYRGEDGAVWTGNFAEITPAVERRSGLLRVLQKQDVTPARDWPWPDITAYLEREQAHPVIERMAKAGLERLAAEFSSPHYSDETGWEFRYLPKDGGHYSKGIDEKEPELARALRIDGARMKRLKALGGSSLTLLWLQEEKRADTIWPDDMIRYFARGRLKPKDFRFLPGKWTWQKVKNYLEKQQAGGTDTAKQMLGTWRDYLDMAKKLGMDTEKEQVYKPKDLRAAHAEAVELLNREGMEKKAKEIRKKWKKVEAVLATLGKYEYASGAYLMRVPESIYDIVREGTLLKHCVHTCDYYFDRIQRRESYLFFLRRAKKPDAPWYTIEAEPGGNIRQKRTMGDNQGEDLKAALPFLKEWQDVVRERLTAEEQELARAADAERKENYRNLRKNGNRVWHGRLAGKLLADVLEQDFMAASL